MVIDTGIFIEHLRSKDKNTTTLYLLPENTPLFISSVALYELYIGATTTEKENDILFLTKDLTTLSFTDEVAIRAAQLYHQLKKNNNMIEFRDIFIAATCLVNEQPLVTLNRKHFERIKELKII